MGLRVLGLGQAAIGEAGIHWCSANTGVAEDLDVAWSRDYLERERESDIYIYTYNRISIYIYL